MNIDTNWHSWTAEMLSGGLDTDLARGLSKKEAAKRAAKNGPNGIWRVKRASVSKAAAQTLLDLSTILLVLASIVSAIFYPANKETFIIILTVAVAAALRVLYYIGSQRIFEEKARGVIPRVRVIRDGEVRIVSAQRLTVGDVVFLEAGDTVPADLRIVSSHDLLVYENKMTENRTIVFKNAEPINEEPGAETPIEKRDNMLYAGTTVVSGEARCVVVATGDATLAVSKFGVLTIPSGERIKLTSVLSKWSRFESLAMIAAVAVIFVIGVIVRDDVRADGGTFRLLLSALSLSVATMSEFFSVLGFAVVAVSVKKADSEECGRAKIKDCASVEVMNDVDTILIESPDMIRSGDITLTSYYLGDSLYNVDEPVEGVSPEKLLRLAYLTTGMLPQGSVFAGGPMPERTGVSLDYAGIHKIYDEYFASSFENRSIDNAAIAGHEPAGSAESGGLDTVLVCRGPGVFEAVVGGPLDPVLACCSHIRKGDRVLPITREDVARIQKECEALRERGIASVALARRDSPYSTLGRVSALQMCMIFEGFISVANRAHGDALDVIRKCREGSTRVVSFTEGSDEDRAFLTLVGILEENDRYITLEEAAGSEKLTLEKGQFAAIATGYRNPSERRREFIRKLRAGGQTVAYITRDAADMWCMKEADVSFAVPGVSKVKKMIPQSIRAASHVVVTPSGNGGGIFESFRVMEFAKSAMLNLRRCANYLVASQLARLVYLIVSFTTPINIADPVLILFWGLILDFAIVTVIAFRDPPWNMISVGKEKRQLPKKLKDIIQPGVIGILWSVLILALPLLLYFVFNAELEVVTSAVFVSAILSVPVVGCEIMTNGSIFKKSKRRSRALPLLIVASAVLSLLFAFSSGFASLISGEVLSIPVYLVCYIPAACALIAFEVRKILTAKKASGTASVK